MTAKIGKLWQTFDEKYAVIGGIESQRKGRIAAYQAAVSNSETERAVQQLADSLKWRLNQWDAEQRKEWREAMDTAFKTFYDSNESLRKSIESQKDGVPQIFLDRHKWQR